MLVITRGSDPSTRGSWPDLAASAPRRPPAWSGVEADPGRETHPAATISNHWKKWLDFREKL